MYTLVKLHVMVRYVMQTTTVAPKTKPRKLSQNREGWGLLALAAPFIVVVFLLNSLPLFGWVYAFFNYKPGIPMSKTPFVGLEYFRIMFSDGDVLRVLRNTLVFGFFMIICSVFPALFAILLSELRSMKIQRFVQSIVTIPYFLSWIIIYAIAFALFSTEGMVNSALESMGLAQAPWNILGNADIVWYFQSSLALWKTLGFNMIIYLAAIASIDGELYDAASIDGANRLQRMRHIIAPGLSATFFVLMVLNISGVLTAGGMDQYLVFYNSLVADRIEVLDYYVYRIGLTTNDYSYATAIGMTKSLVSIALLLSVNLLSRQIRGSSIF